MAFNFHTFTDPGEFLWTSKRKLLLTAMSYTGEYIQHWPTTYKIQISCWGYSIYVINPCAIFIDLNIHLISFWRWKASVFFSSLSALVRLYQCVQHRRQYLSKFINTYSKIVSLCQSFSAPSELISNCLSLSVRTAQSGSLCQTFSVMSVQYQYLSKFVSEKGESQYFSDLVVYVHTQFVL